MRACGCAECLVLLGSLQGPSVTSSDSRIVERSGINGALSWTECPLDMLSCWQMRKIFRQRARRSNQAVKSSRNPVHDVGLLEVYSEPFMGPKHFGIDSPLSVWGASSEASFEFRLESTNISVFPACCDARAWSFFRSLLGIHNFFQCSQRVKTRVSLGRNRRSIQWNTLNILLGIDNLVSGRSVS